MSQKQKIDIIRQTLENNLTILFHVGDIYIWQHNLEITWFTWKVNSFTNHCWR